VRTPGPAALLLLLALSLPSLAEKLPADAENVVVYLLPGHVRWLGGDLYEVKTRSGSWKRFPPEGAAIVGLLVSAGDDGQGVVVRLPRASLQELRRIIEEDIPPHIWRRSDKSDITVLPPHIHSWGGKF
jgi:hypothetical protein